MSGRQVFLRETRRLDYPTIPCHVGVEHAEDRQRASDVDAANSAGIPRRCSGDQGRSSSGQVRSSGDRRIEAASFQLLVVRVTHVNRLVEMLAGPAVLRENETTYAGCLKAKRSAFRRSARP